MTRTRRVAEKSLKMEVESLPKKKSRRKTKKNVLVEFILDETGSMGEHKNSVISGYNEYVDGQRALETKEKCFFSLTKFDTRGIRNVCERTDIRFAPRLDQYNYQPGATTNLYDAIGTRLSLLLADQDLLEDSDVVIVVFTDGYENASREFKYDQVKKLIERCENLGWTFVYMGANQDAWSVGSGLGVTNQYNTKSFDMADAAATFTALNMATATYRSVRGLADTGVGQDYSFFKLDDDNAAEVVSKIKAIEPVGKA